MGDSRFDIPAAVRNGYVFVGREMGYLARFCLLPLGIAILTGFLQTFYLRSMPGTKHSIFGEFLWSMPALAIQGWFIFLEVRLLLLGERIDQLPKDPAYVADRHRSMGLCITIWLLLGMAGTAFSAISIIYLDEDVRSPFIKAFIMFMIGGSIWALRFSVAHILAAVNYPIKRYIFQVNGIAISFRLAGLYIVTVAPVFFAAAGLRSLAVPETTDTNIAALLPENLPEGAAAAVIVLDNIAALVCNVLVAATFSFAMKDLLGRPRQEKAA